MILMNDDGGSDGDCDGVSQAMAMVVMSVMFFVVKAAGCFPSDGKSLGVAFDDRPRKGCC